MKTSTIVVVPRPGTCNIFSSIIIYSLVMQIYFLYNFIPSQEVCYQLICMLINWSVCWSIDLSVYHLIHLFLFTIKSGKVQLVFVVHVSVFFLCSTLLSEGYKISWTIWYFLYITGDMNQFTSYLRYVNIFHNIYILVEIW